MSVTGGIDLEIPDAYYSGPDSEPERIIIPDQIDSIVFKVEALNTGEFNFTLIKSSETTLASVDVSQENPTYIMEIDDDGDGTTDETKEPDSIETLGGVIDTDTPTDPYPYISGTHTGTIMTSCNISVSKLYTYSCPGTGGHAEYVRIYGNGIDENASWAGY